MNKIYAIGIISLLSFMLAVPASAEDSPPATGGSAEEGVETTVVDETATNEATTVDSGDGEQAIDEATFDEPADYTASDEPADEPAPDQTEPTDSAGPVIPTLYISEINWAGSGASSADEWIELFNPGSESVDASGWILTGSATSGEALGLEEGTVIKAGSALLIANYGVGHDKTTLGIEPGLVTASLSIPNSGLSIMLTNPDGVVVDQVSFTGAPDYGSTDPVASMERNLASLEWHTSTSSVNLLDSTQLGTPGVVAAIMNDDIDYIDDSNGEPGETVEEPGDDYDDNIENTPTIYISEINWAGSSGSAADEWIELFNSGNEAVDMNGWILTGSATSGEALDLGEGAVIEAGSTLLIANYGIGHDKTTLGVEPGLVTAALAIPNSGLSIMLVTPDGVVIDEVGFSGAPDFGSTDPRASMERDLSTLEWFTSTSNINLLDSAQLGTPGVVAAIMNDDIDYIDDSNGEPEETVEESNDDDDAVDEQSETPETDGVSPDNEDEAGSGSADATGETLETTRTYQPGDLLISEIVSNPEDGVEWIEIMNPGTEATDMSGWTVRDATGKATGLTSESLGPNGYFVIDDPSGQLNNGGDTVELVDPSGNVIDSVEYGTANIPAPDKGESLALVNGAWQITSALTKNAANLGQDENITSQTYEGIPSDEDNGESPASTASESGSSATAQPKTVQTNNSSARTGNTNVSNEPKTHTVVAIAKSEATDATAKAKTVKKSATSTLTTMTGVITATPGTFGDQIAFMDGVQLYFYFADWPILSIGDIVRVVGTPSENRGESRLKISSQSDIKITGSGGVEAVSMTIGDLASAAEGSLATIVGRIVERQGTTLTLEDDTGEVLIVAHDNTGVSFYELDSHEAQVTGVVRHIDGEARLYPRSVNDVTEIEDEPAAQEDAPALAAVTRTGNYTPLMGAGLLATAAGAIAYWYMRGRRANMVATPA
ncbi:MAG: lamin tail domain-containing protein [bacterium]